ncbi:LeoA/HP0731 family dynamin-like GTPase [Desulfurobacterium atlanticum]|uniref:Small GTP-binding protein domain-containing protein n=1 Tax=Desulfurobacterium atlanticum TaxID=240169 RepID=A0A238XWH7_9BACT|nr:LeoA/HP0731 family dynamin-like GTPase [Desulfurobacterium atlanticum]SNR63040.1 small GTP-binding protein domain-containing protein [Desulfurobacterium atlanticum]
MKEVRWDDLIEKVSKVEKIVNEIKTIGGINVDWIEEKLERTKKDIYGKVFKISVFGGFSDGKSTIISFLLKRNDIEISPEPTTDKVNYYKYKNKNVVIADTPGLFSENLIHDEETKRFISESDLIIFVTDALNPLKESQHRVIKWLLKDLDKKDSTVFVINKIDTMDVDLYNREDFERACKIKKKVVSETLDRIIGENAGNYRIICVAADPWGMGIKYWMENIEEYFSISNMKVLEEIIEETIKSPETMNILFEKKVNSVIKDVKNVFSVELRNNLKSLEISLEELEVELEELDSELRKLEKHITKATRDFKERIRNLRSSILRRIKLCNNTEELGLVVREELGPEAVVLKSKIEDIFYECFTPVTEYLEKSGDIFLKIVEDYQKLKMESSIFASKFLTSATKKTGEILGKIPPDKLRDGILQTRDLLRIPFKFKPWGALKLARFLNTLGPVLGAVSLGMELYNQYKLRREKDNLIEAVDSLFSVFLGDFNSQYIKENYFSAVVEMENLRDAIYDDCKFMRERIENMKNLITKVEELGL